MKFTYPNSFLGLAVACAATGLAAQAQVLTQSFELHPGWNAVWLEVDPPDRNPDVVFAGLPLAGVWTWSDRISATDFIENPRDIGWNRAQWLSYFPPGAPEAPLSNLGAVLPQRAYLLKVARSSDVTWSVSGRTVLRTPAWSPDRFNLRGFPVDPAAAPTFRSFFRASPAHYDVSNQRMEQILRLSPDGQWTAVAGEDTMHRGEAYWVYTRGASDFVAPFQLELSNGEALDFGASTRRIDLTVRNRHALSKTISIQPSSGSDSPLLILPRNPAAQPDGAVPLTLYDQSVGAGGSQRLALGIDRAKLHSSTGPESNAELHTGLLSIRDSEGTLYQVSVSALAAPEPNLTGLWVGTATITNVAAAADSGGASLPGPVPISFPLRLMLHVDAAGQVSLLRQVTLIYTNAPAGTNAPGGGGTGIVTRPTRLLTDPTIVAGLPTDDLRAGRLTGRRLSAPHFDFALVPGQFQLPLTGVFGLSNQISGELSVTSDLPTNPFLHRYHPDHSTNAYAITRQIVLSLGEAANVPPSQTEEAIGGTYSETILGLHKQPLKTSGSILLRRVSDVATLNAN